MKPTNQVVTELLPTELSQWAQQAIDQGSLFATAINRANSQYWKGVVVGMVGLIVGSAITVWILQ